MGSIDNHMKKQKNENGAIMVEAALYMPLVICTVMALIYLAVFNMQEYMLMFQAQKAAAVASREEAYLGYGEFRMGSGKEIDFSWGDGNMPSEDKITAYYEAYHTRLKDLYRGIGRFFSGGTSPDYSSRFADMASESALIALGRISSPEIEVDRGFLGTEIKVTITHSFPIPGVLRYLGYDRSTTIKAAAYSYSVNPGEFVRNVDLAADFIDYVMKKLGLADNYNEFWEKTNKILDVIL